MVFETPVLDVPQPIAVVSITRQGTVLALRLLETLPRCTVFVPARHGFAVAMGAKPYDRLRDIFPDLWGKYRGMVCIMATGIVVRSVAPLLRSKTLDPAVVVVDERGQYVISLLSGHVGGANRMAQVVASLLGAQAVITTGSDVARKVALDTMALAQGLVMEDMTWAARVTTALMDDEPFWIYDPDAHLAPYRAMLSNALWVAEAVPATASRAQDFQKVQKSLQTAFDAAGMDPGVLAGVWVSVSRKPKLYRAVVLRPRTLVVGVGCNRNTPAEEILQVMHDVLDQHHLAVKAVRTLASVDVKENEKGLLEAARAWSCPIVFLSKETLQTQVVPNPSSVVHRHIGVYSVCEAAALQAARNGRLIVQKEKTPNVTVAVAKDGSGS